MVQDGAARGLVDAPRLDAHEAVLDHVDPADPVLAALLVQVVEERDRLRKVDAFRVAHDPDRHRILEVDRPDRSARPAHPRATASA